jgi:lipopolysaccharide export system protein LptA
MRFSHLFLAMLFSLAWAGHLSAANELIAKRSDQPLQIKSNELHTDSSNRTALFSGKVVARQGDITIYSDTLKITYAEKERDVEMVEATGNVRIVQGNRRGEAGHALYDNKKGTITMDGAPRVFDGKSEVKGKVITYFVNEQNSVVTGGGAPGERVTVDFYPERKGGSGGKP